MESSSSKVTAPSRLLCLAATLLALTLSGSLAAGARTLDSSEALPHLFAQSRHPGRVLAFPHEGAVRIAPTRWFSESELDTGARGVGFPRRLLLDRATTSLRLAEAEELSNGAEAGRGVIVGIVDSGVDFTHPDLREADGRTRMVWWLDFGSEPYGFYPELEADYGCTGRALRCGILGRAELDALLEGAELTSPSGERVLPPQDTLGHGTLVASLALGNGQSEPRFRGVAPEATLIGARVATTTAVVDDLDVLLSTRFVFERASELAMPAVVNLSLGGDLGPHDGTSVLERGLSEWVSDAAGRAIVVAAGNSGTLSAPVAPYPGPFGIHTDVHVPEGTRVRVPIVFPPADSENAAVYCWIATARGDRLRVGLEEGAGVRVLPFVDEGERVSASDGERQATLAHHVEANVEASDTARGIVLKLSGPFAANSVFALLLEGEASVDLWLQSEGDLAPERGRGQALFPSATRERTVTLPATSRDVIAVGATLNRTRWSSFGDTVRLRAFDPELELRVGSAMPFSSAGPSSVGALKPDVVAPGGVIVGALARGAEPLVDGRLNPNSMFAFTPMCSALGCAQVNEHYGVALGTSMAAPLVSGAAALLLEKNPKLTHDQLRALLWAGARRPLGSDSRSGAGALDLQGTFQALGLEGPSPAPCEPSNRSWLSFGESYVRPGAATPVVALLHLRDANDRPCDADASTLEVEVTHGVLTKSFERDAGGLLRSSVRAAPGTAGDSLVLRVELGRGASVVASLPIAVDSAVKNRGVSVRGGCSSAPLRPRTGVALALLFVGLTASRIVSPRRRRRARG